MAKKQSQRARLKKAGIRHYDKLIHDQSGQWLRKKFSKGATKYPVNVTKLMRNMIWQTRERIISGEKPPLRELIRTFWYMYFVPTLARAGALAKTTDQYVQLVENIAYLVRDARLMRYKDIGFRDDNQAHRQTGANANIILFSEKLGHQDFLSEMAAKYNVSIIALGGQPSILNIEYFVDTLKEQKINLRRSFYLFGIVDYDPSGWIIRDAFVNNLKFYGIKNTRVFDLINPDVLTPEEIKFVRHPVKAGKSMQVKNENWLSLVQDKKYQNQQYLIRETIRKRKIKKTIYGFKAEAVSAQRLIEKIEQEMVPLIGKNEKMLKTFELRKLDQTIKKLIIHKIT